jgi:ATP-dependent Clp protease protease subunit
MHEIKIYGEIVPFEEDWIIEQGGYVNLSSVQNQLSKAEGKDIFVRLRSFGGDVETGFSIYNELRRYAKDNNAKIKILGEGQVASIATVIFLAGDERILTGHTEPFVHNAWTYSEGDSKKLLRVANELDNWNKNIAEHYALHTDLTKEESLALMQNETSISAEEAVKMRFATSIEEVLRPVALKRFNINKKEVIMNKKTQTLLNKAMQFLKGFSNKVVETADGKELDFFELEDSGVIELGVKATFDGNDAEGSFIMLSGETYVFVGGELTEIIPSEEEMTIDDAKAEILALTQQLEAITNKAVELDLQNKSKDVLISNFKASSKAIPKQEKESPKSNIEKQTNASLAVSNFNKFKTK